MPRTRVFASAESRRDALLRGVTLLVAFVAAWVLVRRFVPFLADADVIRASVRQFGVLAPLVFVSLQAVQVVLAPIPGQVMGVAGGYLFGTVAG